MQFIHFHRRNISFFVMLTFTVLLCFWGNQAPAAPANPEAEKSTVALSAGGEEEAPGFIEEEEAAPVAKKGKKFPWLIVGAVVVIGAAAVYFLVLKKTKYELTVNLGEGCTGMPGATAKFKKGEVVSYSYSTNPGWGNMQVKLDGTVVAASGTVTMDKAHTIDISATYGAVVNISSTPSGAKVYDNNVDTGKTTPASFSYPNAGSHTYLLRQCGHQDFSRTQSVVVGQTYNIAASMVPGIYDDFLVPATCWSPFVAGGWTVSGGIYKCLSTQRDWDYNYYNSVIGSANFTVEARMRKVEGTGNNSVSILLATNTNVNSVSGYLFNYVPDGWYSIWRETNVNWTTGSGGTSSSIKSWADTARINKGMNTWNTMKIVRSGNNYSFYMNGFLIASFSDSSHDVRVVILTFSTGNKASEMQYDYVKLDVGSTTGLMPPDTVASSLPTANQKHSGYK